MGSRTPRHEIKMAAAFLRSTPSVQDKTREYGGRKRTFMASAAAAVLQSNQLTSDQLRYEYTAHALVSFSVASVRSLS